MRGRRNETFLGPSRLQTLPCTCRWLPGAKLTSLVNILIKMMKYSISVYFNDNENITGSL